MNVITLMTHLTNQGYDIIEHMKAACQFESVHDNGKVKIHDVIRDAALWLATAYNGNSNKIVVKENDIVETYQVSNWKQAQKVSI